MFHAVTVVVSRVVGIPQYLAIIYLGVIGLAVVVRVILVVVKHRPANRQAILAVAFSHHHAAQQTRLRHALLVKVHVAQPFQITLQLNGRTLHVPHHALVLLQTH